MMEYLRNMRYVTVPVHDGFGLGITDMSDLGLEQQVALIADPAMMLQNLAKLISKAALYEDAYLHMWDQTVGDDGITMVIMFGFLLVFILSNAYYLQHSKLTGPFMNPINIKMVQRCLYGEIWNIAQRMVLTGEAYPQLLIDHPHLFELHSKVSPEAFTHVSMSVSYLIGGGLIGIFLMCDQTCWILAGFAQTGQYKQLKYHTRTPTIYAAILHSILSHNEDISPLLQAIARW